MTSSLCRFASSLICRWSLAVAVVSMVVAHAPAHAVIIDWVTVGDPGNVADTTGTPNPAGAVLDSFQIMKYEWTNS
jgi:sulfatase modifying factor 1